MARAEAGKATAARCSGLARPFICLAKWPERLCHRGAGGLLASPHSHPYPPPPPPNPALSPDRPHLSGQQEFPFFCLPQLHHVRQGLNRCTNQKHTHRVCVVFFFNARKRNALPVSLPSPLHPPHQKQVSLFLLQAEATREGSPGSEHNGRVEAGGPSDREATASRTGGLPAWCWGDRSEAAPRGAAGRPHPAASGAGISVSAGWVPGGPARETKLQEAGPRRGPSARRTKRGLRPGCLGAPRTKAPGRARARG